MKVKVLWGLVVVLFIALIIALYQQLTTTEVARIEQKVISEQEFVNELIKRHGSQLLKEMIEKEAISFEAKRLAVEVSEREVDKEIEKYRHNFMDSNKDLETLLLEEYGIVLAQLKEDIRYNLLLEKLATLDVKVTESEIEKYYQENIDQYKEPAKLHIRRILVKDRDEANRVRRDLQEGADFAALAMEVSQDRITAANGGDLGYISVDSIYVDFEIIDTALRLNVGQYSQPFYNFEGWNIILLEDITEEKLYDFAEVKPLIHRELALRQAAKPLNEYLQDLIRKLDVEIQNPLVQSNLK
ncbi:hypothetical protein BHU72_11255 [Desulfuribacillus stibiiarsenatis]|uniref:peptidylprolyl isomerase n=1 Tax=Desulfuribacillus stibiiarsenatis TaxID=1390249 RepID=A0A1E5L2L6_9FIRM|nr:peptidyl-prolyl cis-trans isomerase [Desulfuribacillus stibiiarsenatis]OEH84370.1 hypothetical protein BHU72_11255 [Desulfuribacillus stibiiarsenatis]